VAVSTIGSSTASGVTTAGSAASSTLGLSQNDFMKLLVTQMQNQNPLNPVNSTDFITQLAQFSQVSSMTTLNGNISQMLTLQQMTQASSLIGKTVTYLPAGSQMATSGVVSGVQINNGAVNLVVGNQSIALSQVTGIQKTGGTTA
jgi:flagellar basal-body rod modification protein FlgD